jgi:AcrR family transcriptional regulator
MPDTEAGDKPALSRVARKREQRVDAILRVASRVLAEHGYHGTSLEMIADRMDLTKASLYYYYESKDALILACLERVALQSIDAMEAIAALETDLVERLKAMIIEQLGLYTHSEPDLARLFLQHMDWPDEIAREMRRWRATHRRPFDRIIDEGVATGVFAPEHDEVARHCMFGAINHFPVWFRPKSATKDAQVRQAVADELVAMFRPR